MTLKRNKPFEKQTLDEEKPQNNKERIFTMRLNLEEQKWLEEIKEDLNIKSDAKAMKFAAVVGRNVLQTLFGRSILRYLFKKDRVKLEHYKNF